MEVLVFNPLLELAGGSEKLTLELARALEELGHDVKVYTYFTDRNALDNALNLLTPNYRPKMIAEEVKDLRFKLMDIVAMGRFIKLKRLLLLKDFIGKIGKKVKAYDLVIDAASNIPLDGFVSYIHYPINVRISDDSYEGSGLLYRVYDWLTSRHARKLTGNPKLVLTNSTWTKERILAIYPSMRSKVEVLHPPVDVDYYAEAAQNDKREKLIVTISRYTPEKGLERILDVAKELPNYMFIIVGSTARYSKLVLDKLRKRKESEAINNVEFQVNLPKCELRNILAKAKYYLHPPFPEHFGIAIAEAMAAGCIPIVYKDGGGWTDLVAPISTSLGYSKIREIPNIITYLDKNSELYGILRMKAIQHALEFTYENFKNKLKNLINKIKLSW